ncbi:hypothetical protein JOD64_003789 [Micromonospora luteifusca]|uniref:Dyp-type peroxidase C-terminal domain-containing protein n=1 Tax=Micromonospora luteifusca TaxID=709860 RepID=A0ABS2LWL2_9ACTN|nr:Dyp-type peroxidase domain-containing protein [Micromonospora luteifusca]MBM7492567.1 hypothetical protein [Micromonospora luteifusca]
MAHSSPKTERLISSRRSFSAQRACAVAIATSHSRAAVGPSGSEPSPPSFQADLDRGFVAVQRRLASEALGKYVLTFGGGYFFVPAGQTGVGLPR